MGISVTMITQSFVSRWKGTLGICHPPGSRRSPLVRMKTDLSYLVIHKTYTYANPGSTKAVNQREARENKQVFSHDPDTQKTQNWNIRIDVDLGDEHTVIQQTMWEIGVAGETGVLTETRKLNELWPQHVTLYPGTWKGTHHSLIIVLCRQVDLLHDKHDKFDVRSSSTTSINLIHIHKLNTNVFIRQAIESRQFNISQDKPIKSFFPLFQYKHELVQHLRLDKINFYKVCWDHIILIDHSYWCWSIVGGSNRSKTKVQLMLNSHRWAPTR